MSVYEWQGYLTPDPKERPRLLNKLLRMKTRPADREYQRARRLSASVKRRLSPEFDAKIAAVRKALQVAENLVAKYRGMMDTGQTTYPSYDGTPASTSEALKAWRNDLSNRKVTLRRLEGEQEEALKLVGGRV